MKKIFFLAAAAYSMYGESTIEGPKSGYIASATGIRTVLGTLGAARLSVPFGSTVQNASVLPGQDVAFGTSPDGELVRLNLADGSIKALGDRAAGLLLASPSGEAAATFGDQAIHTFAKDGSRVADIAFSGTPVLAAVSDSGRLVAMTVAEPEGEAVYLVDGEASRRVFAAQKIVALTFIPDSSDVILGDNSGAIYRIAGSLELTQLAVVENLHALASTSQRVVAVAGRIVQSIPLNGGAQTVAECSCTATIARPLGASKFLITDGEHGPIWVVDAFSTELRLAFIPEAVNE